MPTTQFDAWLETLSDLDRKNYEEAKRRQTAGWQAALDSGSIIEKVEWSDTADQNSNPVSHEYVFSEENPHKDDAEWAQYNQMYVQWCKGNNLEIVW